MGMCLCISIRSSGTSDNLATALDFQPQGQGVLPLGAALRPLWVQAAFIAWPHPFCDCLPDSGPEEFTVHS
ncbi:hypothetical protein JOQ06_026394, partial [Pogonophryne albipinna]